MYLVIKKVKHIKKIPIENSKSIIGLKLFKRKMFITLLVFSTIMSFVSIKCITQYIYRDKGKLYRYSDYRVYAFRTIYIYI